MSKSSSFQPRSIYRPKHRKGGKKKSEKKHSQKRSLSRNSSKISSGPKPTSHRAGGFHFLQKLQATCPITKWIRSKPFADCEEKISKDSLFRTYHGQRVSDQVYGPADTQVAASFVSLNQVYRFRLGGHSDINATTGVINTFFACDPSSAGTNFPEWTTLSSLFSEFRLVEYGVQFVTDWNLNNGGTYGSTTVGLPTCVVAGNLGTAGAPGSLAAISDNADACYVQFSRMTNVTGYTHVINGSGVQWSQVVTPTVTPYAGAPGSIQIYGNFGSTTQGNAIRCLVWGIYDFRSRI